jgi:peroxiredoxin
MPQVALDVPAPDFQLADFRNETFRLADRRGSSNVLLVFNRGFM